MDVLNDTIAELRRIVQVGEEIFGSAAVLRWRPMLAAKLFYRNGNIPFWQRDVLVTSLPWVLVLPPRIDDTRRSDIGYRPVGS